MSDIFISYKREDKAIAQIVAKILRLKGFSVFWDSDIDFGDTYDERIQNELDSAKCVMVLWSKKSVKSENVRAEATSGKNRLVPVLIEDVNIPVPFNLKQTANLIDWEGDPYHPVFLKLLKDVLEKVGRSP